MGADSNTKAGEGGAEVLDISGVSALLGCSPSHVRALTRAGAFPAPAKLGALARWSRAVVLAWIAENTGRTIDRAGKTVTVRG